MGSSSIDDMQDLILENAMKISKNAKEKNKRLSQSFAQNLLWFSQQSADSFSSTLGNFSSIICRFASKVDYEHPYLYDLFSENKFTETHMDLVRQLAELSPHVKDKPLAAEVIRNVFLKNKEKNYSENSALAHGVSYRDVINKLSKPPVRILKNADDRLSARKLKKNPKSIGLSSVVENVACDYVPNDFSSYVCGYSYDNELKKFQDMSDAFIEASADPFVSYVNKDIEKLKLKTSEQYYGFVRLKPSDAALILAKSLGATWKSSSKCITFHKDQLSNYKFWDDSKSFDFNIIRYHPNYYPLHTFNVEMPDKVKKMVNLVENYPSIGNRPIFDHFWVVCPSFHLDAKLFANKGKNKWKIKLDDETVSVDWDSESAGPGEVNKANTILDSHLTSKGHIVPVVLGERNGECFFLCNWR